MPNENPDDNSKTINIPLEKDTIIREYSYVCSEFAEVEKLV